MARPIDELSRRQRQEWGALGALLVGVAVLVAWLLWDARLRLDRAERDRLQAQSRSVQRILAQQLEATYGAMTGMRDNLLLWSPQGDAAIGSRRLKALAAAVPGVSDFAFIDRQGRVLSSGAASLVGTVPGPRPSAADAGRLRVWPPNHGPAGVGAILLVMPLDEAAGGGAILAALDSDYFRVVLRSARYADDVRAAIVHAAGGVAAVEPDDPALAGSSLVRPGSFFLRHLDSGREDNLFEGEVKSTGELRLVVMRNLQPARVPMDVPLVLTISRDLATVTAPWRLQTEVDLALFALLALGLACSLGLLQRRQRLGAMREREEAERLELALHGADLALWDIDFKSGHVTVNARWSEMLGYAPDSIPVGEQAWRDRVHPDDLEQVAHLRQAHLDGVGPAYEAVYRMRHRDGHWVWVLARGKVLARAADGRPLRMAGTHMDITRRMEDEQALRRSERKLAITLHSIGDAVIATDEQGIVTRINATGERLTGWKEAEAKGRPLSDVFRIFNPHTGEPVANPVHEVLRRGEVVGLANDTLLMGRDGTSVPIADSAAPIRTAEGVITGVVLVFSDISERYRVQQALRDRERLLSGITDALPGPISRSDTQGRYLFANAAYAKWFGLTPAQVVGRTQREVLGQQQDAALEPYTQRVLTGETVQFEHSLRTADGQHRHALVTLVPEHDADGRLCGHITVVTDITERKNAEAERQALGQQLRESQKMESIGTLAGGIAHDFNNILAAILGNVALARLADVDAGALQSHLAQIQRAALRARSLVQQILAFSRRDPGLLTEQPLRPVLDETLALLRATLPAAVRVEAVLPAEPLGVRADATQLQQVLMNLATNAWHALPERGGRIEIGAERLSAQLAPALGHVAPGPLAHLWVRDNGSGMDEATLARIFDPFFTTKPVGQGTGLGLSVVHGIVRAHEGAITVDSAPGSGSTFHLYLPSPELPAEPTDAERAQVGVITGNGRHVLYVDDDEVVVIMAERLLERAGYRVTVCGGAAQALELVRSQDFDAVVTDYNMPDQSGLDLARQLSTLVPGLPVILSSGLMSEELRMQAMQAGVKAVLRKERSVEELADAVGRALGPGTAAPRIGR
jgi:PAS domain S-box-containing protein